MSVSRLDDCNGLLGKWNPKCNSDTAKQVEEKRKDGESGQIRKKLRDAITSNITTEQQTEQADPNSVKHERCKQESGLSDMPLDCGWLDSGCKTKQRRKNETDTSVFNACMNGATITDMAEVRQAKNDSYNIDDTAGGKRKKKTKSKRRRTKRRRTKKRFNMRQTR